jgi:hypothetical protein
MTKTAVRRRSTVLGSAIAAVLLSAAVVPSPASTDGARNARSIAPDTYRSANSYYHICIENSDWLPPGETTLDRVRVA